MLLEDIVISYSSLHKEKHMKYKKRLLGSSLALMFALPLTFVITSCNGNNVKHNFSENWELQTLNIGTNA